MSIRGVPQLQKLLVVYCDVGVSSQGTRTFLQSYLKQFRAQNPAVQFKFAVSRTPQMAGVHPYLLGIYRHGAERKIGVANLSAEGVLMHAWQLANSTGYPRRPFTGHYVEKHTTSVQGPWSPYLWLLDGESQNAMPHEQQFQKAKEETARQQLMTRTEKVYRDELEYVAIGEARQRMKRIQAEKGMPHRFAEPQHDKPFRVMQKKWNTAT